MHKNNRLLSFSILDGGVRTLLLFILCEFSVSELLVNWGLDIYRTPFVFGGIFALLSGVLSFLLTFRLTDRRHIFLFWISSFCCFLLGCGLLFLNKMSIKISLFPTRALGVGDGLTLIFTFTSFFLCSEIIRIICLAVLLLRRKPTDAV